MLTKGQRRLSAITAAAVAVTRVWARAATLWDWDEALFTRAVRTYDVTQHHPHPPGYPLFIALAKFARIFLHNDFHALQAISTLAAIALFPLLVWLALELRFPFRTAYLGALLCVFLPNVWYYGGTGFSDIPALALTLAACAALLRGRTSTRAYLAGAFLLGLAAAIRPQALLIGCAPAVVASWPRIRTKRIGPVLAATAIGIAVIVISYGGAALASASVRGYVDATHAQSQWVRNVDSFLAPNRPPLLSLFPLFFIHEVPTALAAWLAVLALISLAASIVRRQPRVWLLAAIFLPFNIAAWFMLDVTSVSRYATNDMPLYALLAADGVEALILLFTRREIAIACVQSLVVVAGAVRFAWWTVPVLRTVRRTASPPVAAMRWIRDHVARPGPVYVHAGMGPFADCFLSDYTTVVVDDPKEIPMGAFVAGGWFVREGATSAAGGQNFVRDRAGIERIVRQRYFETNVAPLSGLASFGEGWYGDESYGSREWRWMGRHSVAMLPPISGNARLALAFDIPTELVAQHPNVEVRLNGQLIDRIVCTSASMSKGWTVPVRPDAWNQLDLTVDRVLNPAKAGLSSDARDLGLELTSYAWTSANAGVAVVDAPRLQSAPKPARALPR